MSRRAIWKGVVDFADVRAPVKLYAAVDDDRVNFHLLHDRDGVRLRQRLICEREGQSVDSDEIVRGLELDDRTYVVVEDAELAELEPDSAREITVMRFVDPGEVDPRYFDRPYHLGADGESHKYAALVSAMERTGRAGLCQWSFRKRSYNGLMRVRDGRLELVTLRLAEEVSAADGLDLPEATPTERERKTARYLVEEMTDAFDPSEYRDSFRDSLLALIEAKARGEAVPSRDVEPPEATDTEALADVLHASLEHIRQTKNARSKSGDP